MSSVERVTVTLPDDLVREIDRLERNRSKFIAEAVRREIDRRRREQLRRSLESPHPESIELAEQGWRNGSALFPRKMSIRFSTAGPARLFGGCLRKDGQT